MKQTRMMALVWKLFSGAFMAFWFISGSPVWAVDAPNFKPKLVASTPVTVNNITCRNQLEGVIPTSSTKAKFSPWPRMNPYTFLDGAGSYTAQCKATIGEMPWLTAEVCEDFEQALREGNCAVVKDVNYIDLDVVRGKRGGKSTAFLYEAMRLKEQRQAIFVPVGDKWLGVFAGEPGKSCNNFFAINTAPPERVKVVYPPPVVKKPEPAQKPVARVAAKPPVPRVIPATPPPASKGPAPVQPVVRAAIPPEHYMVHTGWVDSNVSYQHVPAIAVGGHVVSGQVIVNDNGQQSFGQTKVDGYNQ